MAYVYVDDDASKHKFSSFSIALEPQRIDFHSKQNGVISLISLEKAVEPLVEFVPTIHEKVKLARQNCTNTSDRLFLDESAAIYLLTMRWKPDDECFYSVLNAILRDHSPRKLKPWKLYLQLLFTALDRLPSTDIIFYREMEHDLVKNYSKGNFFIFWDFTLCAISGALSKSNLPEHPGTKKTVFAFECCNAKFIERHSHVYSNSEYLFIPTQFQFIGYLDRRNDLDIIQLREVKQSFPLIQFINVSNEPCSITSTTEVSQKTTTIMSVEKFDRNSKLERHILLHQRRSDISLSYQKLTAEDMPIVIEQAIIGKQCTRLLLNNNQITIECLSILVPALHNDTTLQGLYLNEVGLTDESTQILTQTLALDNCSIYVLNLSRNHITDRSVPHIIEMLSKNTTLIRVYLYPNPISRKGVKQLRKALGNDTRLSTT